MIPKVLYRTVKDETDPEAERLWKIAKDLHPTWQHRTILCSSLERVVLVRLATLYVSGGWFIDSDVECIRPFDPLYDNEFVAGFEDDTWVCDAVMGSVPNHPAVRAAYDLTKERMDANGGLCIDDRGCPMSVAALTEVVTTVGPGTGQVTLMYPVAFYPYHWSEKERAVEDFSLNPETFCVHHWAGSWIAPAWADARTLPPAPHGREVLTL